MNIEFFNELLDKMAHGNIIGSAMVMLFFAPVTRLITSPFFKFPAAKQLSFNTGKCLVTFFKMILAPVTAEANINLKRLLWLPGKGSEVVSVF